MNIGEMLKKKRLELGMTRGEAAREMGVSESQLCRWENRNQAFYRKSRRIIELFLHRKLPLRMKNVVESHHDLDTVKSWCVLIPTSVVKELFGKI